MEAQGRSDRGWRRQTSLRVGALALLATAAAIGLAACGGSGSPQVVSLATTTGNTVSTTTASSSGGSTTTGAKGADPTKLVDQWAACIRRHGHPNQADPVIDSHGVINILVPPVTGGLPVVTGGPETAKGTCSQYLAAAQQALRAANPVSPPPNRSELISYVTCMRANGIANYPYPTGEKGNFNGTGINLSSPTFLHANDVCGKRIHAPAWWVNGWGPPGDVSVKTAFPGGHSPLPAGPTGSNGTGSGG
jgi:hypothetical protein